MSVLANDAHSSFGTEWFPSAFHWVKQLTDYP